MYNNDKTALAVIRGGNLYPEINGTVYFYEVPGGTELIATICGLPPYKPATSTTQPVGPFGFHIHEYGICRITDPNNPFESAGGHYNPTNQPHPEQAEVVAFANINGQFHLSLRNPIDNDILDLEYYSTVNFESYKER